MRRFLISSAFMAVFALTALLTFTLLQVYENRDRIEDFQTRNTQERVEGLRTVLDSNADTLKEVAKAQAAQERSTRQMERLMRRLFAIHDPGSDYSGGERQSTPYGPQNPNPDGGDGKPGDPRPGPKPSPKPSPSPTPTCLPVLGCL